MISEAGEKRALGEVPREQKMLKGHLSRVINHQEGARRGRRCVPHILAFFWRGYDSVCHQPSRKEQSSFSRFPRQLFFYTENGAFSLDLTSAEVRMRLSVGVNLISQIGRFGPSVRVGGPDGVAPPAGAADTFTGVPRA